MVTKVETAQRTKFPASKVIMAEGQEANEFFELEKGTIKVIRPDGETIVISKEKGGRRIFFGESAFLVGPWCRRTATVIAETGITTIRFSGSKDEFFKELKEREGLAQALLQDLALRAENASKEVGRLRKENEALKTKLAKNKK